MSQLWSSEGSAHPLRPANLESMGKVHIQQRMCEKARNQPRPLGDVIHTWQGADARVRDGTDRNRNQWGAEAVMGACRCHGPCGVGEAAWKANVCPCVSCESKAQQVMSIQAKCMGKCDTHGFPSIQSGRGLREGPGGLCT